MFTISWHNDGFMLPCSHPNSPFTPDAWGIVHVLKTRDMKSIDLSYLMPTLWDDRSNSRFKFSLSTKQSSLISIDFDKLWENYWWYLVQIQKQGTMSQRKCILQTIFLKKKQKNTKPDKHKIKSNATPLLALWKSSMGFCLGKNKEPAVQNSQAAIQGHSMCTHLNASLNLSHLQIKSRESSLQQGQESSMHPNCFERKGASGPLKST